MLSYLANRKFSHTIKPLLSQLLRRYVFTVFYLNSSLRCIQRLLSHLQSAGQQ